MHVLVVLCCYIPMTAGFCIVYGGFNLAPMHIWLPEVAKLCCFFHFLSEPPEIVWSDLYAAVSQQIVFTYGYSQTCHANLAVLMTWHSLQAVTLSQEQTQLICASTRWDVDSQQMHSSIFQNFPWEWGGWGIPPDPLTRVHFAHSILTSKGIIHINA